MGVLVIPNSDFSLSAIKTIDLSIIEPFSSCILSGYKSIRYMDMTRYSSVLGCYNNSNIPYEGLFVYDVSAYNGDTIKIKAAHKVSSSGADFCCFAFNADMESIEDFYDSAEENESLAGPTLTGKINAVENFNVSAQDNIANTITKVVPAGAKYLFITNNVHYLSLPEVKLL